MGRMLSYTYTTSAIYGNILGRYTSGKSSEFTDPVEAFRRAGHAVITVGMQQGKTVKGKKEGTKVILDVSGKEVGVSTFDILSIPGGYSPDKLRVDEDAVGFTKEFVESGKPLFAICHAPQLLITADVLRSRKITGWKSTIQDIKNAGGKFTEQELVVGGNIVSSRHPGDFPAFIDACMREITH